MVSNTTENLVNWRLFSGRLAIAALATVGAISLLGSVHNWPPGTGQAILVSLVLAELALGGWCAFSARGPVAIFCFVLALVVMAVAVVAGIVGYLEVDCWTGHGVSF